MPDTTINTYKSDWIAHHNGDYTRIQKPRYALDFLDQPWLRRLPGIGRLCGLLGRKMAGPESYQCYVELLENLKDSRGKWEGETALLTRHVGEIGIALPGKSVLDVSGEPGFFASDLTSMGAQVALTALHADVAQAMQARFGVEAQAFDYQKDSLSTLFAGRVFDIIFVRYSIGFCEDIDRFFGQCSALLPAGGILYLSFSPASRAVCARWMFDDYTYLRQYTLKTLCDTAEHHGFRVKTELEESRYPWHHRLHPVQLALTLPYIRSIFAGCDAKERIQYNHVVMFTKHAADPSPGS